MAHFLKKVWSFLVKENDGSYWPKWYDVVVMTNPQTLFSIVLGSGCGSVGRAVASDTRGPRFESHHQKNLFISIEHLFTINCVLERRK